jgi:hypothetical protein
MLAIDLDRPASERWRPLERWAAPARALLDVYERDLGSAATDALDLITVAAERVLPTETRAELAGVASVVGDAPARVLLCNLSYDLIKSSVGCSAFALDTPEGPVHARNLDWWTSGGLLRDETLVVDCRRRGATRYKLIGWPGFIGCFSGVAPGRFAVTLNAVLSDDAACIAEPVVFLLRRVLDEAPDWASALRLLRDTHIASDCLLLLTGTRPGELVVIERTPTRAALRWAERGVLHVTNEYRALGSTRPVAGSLGGTSCGRADRLGELLRSGRVRDGESAFAALADPRVRMDITVQQMVLHAASGRCEVRLPR